MNDIHIQAVRGPTIPETDIEIVERKGLGHPDTICDAVMERFSQVFSQTCLERFGTILHFNFDKALLSAGRVERRFGGGKVLEPMRLIIGDRASSSWKGKNLDVAALAVESSKAWFREILPRVNPDRHLDFQVELKPGSEELAALFSEKKGTLGANDTSAAVGYAPLTETERLVLATERHLNSPEFKSGFPETGMDVKVMGVRRGRRLGLTVAMPLIDEFIQTEADYFRRKEAVHEALQTDLDRQLEDLDAVTVQINTLDRRGAGMGGIYLSVLGTSAEDADSGEVGRGNEVNGLIPLNRPRGSEAAAGKNPVSHVGKIYSVLTHRLADRIYRRFPQMRSVEVWLCSRIGDPIDQPQITSVQVHLKEGVELADLAKSIKDTVREEMSRMPKFCEELIQGKWPVF